MATGFGKWLEDLKKGIGGFVGSVDDAIVPGAGRASDVAKGAFMGFDTAARNTAADLSGLLGFNQASQQLQQRADRQRQFLNTNPTMNAASQFGSLLNAPGNFAYNAAFKPGYNMVNNAALTTASLQQGLDPMVSAGYGLQTGLNALQVGTLGMRAPLPGLGSKPLIAFNPVRNAVGGLLEQNRTGVQKDLSQLLGNESSVSQGLGIENPLLALGVDTLTDPTAAPAIAKATIRGGQLALRGAQAGVQGSKPVIQGLQRSLAPTADDMLDVAAKNLDNAGLRDAIRQIRQDRWSRNLTGSREDMRRLASDLGLPQVTQHMSASELKNIFDNIYDGKPLTDVVRKKLEISRSQGGFARISNQPQFPIDPSKVKITSGNTNQGRIKTQDQINLHAAVEEAKPMIEKVVGKTLTHEEVQQAAQVVSDDLIKTVGRESTEQLGAAQLRLRQNIAAMADNGTVTRELLESLRADASFAASTARLLGQRAIDARPTTPVGKLKALYLQNILKVNDDIDSVLAAADKVDWTDKRQADAFYRQFIQPTLGDWVDKIRYNSMLSSPSTHVTNIVSNFQGGGIIQPITMGAEGMVDALASVFSQGRSRTRFAGEGVAFTKGYYGAAKEAWGNFLSTLKGQTMDDNPDIRQVSLAQGGFAGAAESTLGIVTRALGAADQFFATLAKGGFENSNSYRAARGVQAGRDVARSSDELLFRQDLTREGAGVVTNFIGAGGKFIQQATHSDNQSVRWLAKLTVPFVNIGTNLAKVGAEYNPALGALNLIGNTDKVGQVGKLAVGSSVALIAGGLALNDRLTFGEPTSKKEKEAFRAAGMQPYAIKIGDNWISYQKMHPAIAFQLATVGAVTQAMKEGKITEDAGARLVEGAWNGLQFVADQTYFKSVGDFVGSMEGDSERIGRMIANYPTQAIPFRATLSWINRMIDTVQRKPDTEASVITQTLQSVAMQIPGLSSGVPERTGPDGLPIKSDYPVLNAFSPNRVTQEKPGMRNYYDQLVELNNLKSDNRAINDFIKNGGDPSLFLAGSRSTTGSTGTTGTTLSKLEVGKLKATKTQLESRLDALAISGNTEGYTAAQTQLEAINKQLAVVGLQDKVNELSKRKSDGSALSSSSLKGDVMTLAKDIGRQVIDGELDAGTAVPLLKQLGVEDPMDIEYAIAADLPDEEQAAYAWEALNSGADINKLIQTDVLTTSVAKVLAEQGHITWDQYDGLKELIDSKVAKGGSARPKKGKKISIKINRSAGPKAPAFISMNTGGSRITPPKFKRITA